jgi:transposase InsO family protein
MFKDVVKFVSTCNECQLNKQPTSKPAGVPHILPVPGRPWQSMTKDFVGPLTEFQRFKNILVIMDRFSGFLLCFPLPEKYSAIHAADTFLHTFYGRYRLPEPIISDRDSRFPGKLWQTLQKTMGIELRLSTAFHQVTNRQVERTNITIMQMLRIYANSPGSNWAGNLWGVEHAHNTAKATWHDKSPFEMVHGHPPNRNSLATHRKPTTRGRTVPRPHGYAAEDSKRRSPPSTILNGRNCGQTTKPTNLL